MIMIMIIIDDYDYDYDDDCYGSIVTFLVHIWATGPSDGFIFLAGAFLDSTALQ